jgi:F-box-like
VIRIDVLPDEILLAIFGHYVDELQNSKKGIEAWQSLVHVCRSWRRVVWGSPHRLDLQLVCTPATPAKDTLDAWPPLPLLIQGAISSTSSVDNIVVALGRSSRICSIELYGFSGWQLEKVLSAMQQPFPEMVYLLLHCEEETAPVILDSFMSGSAPRLRYLELERIPFPRLPKLLLSATHLIKLHLSIIPHSGYISPEAMVTGLSMLTSLETLSLQFHSPRSHPDWEGQPPPPTIRSVLPTLMYFRFKGVNEYLEDLVARIDAPRLNGLDVTFFNQIDFDTPLLAQFISRTPTFKAPNETSVFFHESAVRVTLLSPTAISEGSEGPNIAISCRESDWQLSSLAQVCASSVPLLSTVEKLYIQSVPWPGPWKNGIENILWLEFLRSFTALKILHIDGELTSITSTLQELGGRMTEVLPTLQNINISRMTSSTTTRGSKFTGASHSSKPRFEQTFPRHSSHTSI